MLTLVQKHWSCHADTGPTHWSWHADTGPKTLIMTCWHWSNTLIMICWHWSRNTELLYFLYTDRDMLTQSITVNCTWCAQHWSWHADTVYNSELYLVCTALIVTCWHTVYNSELYLVCTALTVTCWHTVYNSELYLVCTALIMTCWHTIYNSELYLLCTDSQLVRTDIPTHSLFLICVYIWFVVTVD